MLLIEYKQQLNSGGMYDQMADSLLKQAIEDDDISDDEYVELLDYHEQLGFNFPNETDNGNNDNSGSKADDNTGGN